MSFNAFRGEEFVRGEFEPASFLWGGDPVQEVLKVLKGSEVSSRAYTRVPVVGVTTGGRKRRRESVGVGRGERRDGSRQALASAGGGTVQSDLRRGASETGTVPTARVCHKEPFRARPHPSPEPARRSARTSGRRAGENRASGPCRTARPLYWIGTATSGHHNVPRGLAAEVGEGVHCPRRRRRGGLGSPRRRLGGDRVRQCA